ncbi:MAG: SGNH/GDSL hydrolase family protein [Chloroflexota bacterium]
MMNLDTRWAALTAVLLLLLLISAGLNVVLLKQARHAMRQWALTALDPVGLRSVEEQTMRGETAQKTVLFFGDSRAVSWTPPEMAGVNFVNRGVNGNTSEQALARFAAHVTPLQPDVLVAQVCVNDLRAIPVLPGQKSEITARCMENIDEMVKRVKEGETAVILTTIFPVQPPPPLERMYWSHDVVTAIETVNDHIRSLAGENVVVLDAHALLADEQGFLRDDYAADNLHLNAAGYRRLNEAFAPLLQELMRDT